ncbi:hypothetical protein, partial [Listeria monocytogenes]|uniref:hypothetical protein n=1 Tax=Listeria monocytogenes TaxID=1639 RepID=UPI002FDC5B77
SIAAQYVEAVATGGTIKIPIVEYAANIANTEADASIVEHLKQSPSAMSHAQQVEFDATKDEALQQELHAAMQKLDDETNFNNGREAVK